MNSAVQKHVDSSDGVAHLFGKTRYVILLLSTLCLSCSISNSLALNFTVICMEDLLPSSNRTGDPHWLLSSTHVNGLFSAVAIGCLIGTVPLTTVVHVWGMRGTISLYGGVSALATVFFPFAVSVGYPAIFLMRILQGIPTCLSYPGTGLVASQWSTFKGAGTFIAILSCHRQFASIFTMPIAGQLCESDFGWRSVYYLQGTISLAAHALFVLFYEDDPEKQRFMGATELKRITAGKENQSRSKTIPYRKICVDPCVVSIWTSLIGSTLGFQIFVLYGPTYLNRVLHFNVTSTGFASSLPYLLAAFAKFGLGPISDKLRFVSSRTKMVFFATLSQVAMAISFVLLTKTKSTVLAQIAYTGSIVFSAFNCVGSVKCASLVCRQYVHFVLSLVALFQCLIVLFVPIAVDMICPNNTVEEWSILLTGISVFIVIASLPFVFTARAEPAQWTIERTFSIVEKKLENVE